MSTPFLPSQVRSHVHVRQCLSMEPLRGSWREVKKLKLHLSLLGISAVLPMMVMEGLGCYLLLPFPLNSINFLLVSVSSSVGQSIFQCGAVKCRFCPPGSWLQSNKCDDVLCVHWQGSPGRRGPQGEQGEPGPKVSP